MLITMLICNRLCLKSAKHLEKSLKPLNIDVKYDAKLHQVALIDFRFEQLKMAFRKTMPSITVYFKTSTFNREAVKH